VSGAKIDLHKKHDKRKVTSRAHSLPSKCNSSREQVEARVSGRGGAPGWAHVLIFGQAYLLQAPIQSRGDSIKVTGAKTVDSGDSVTHQTEGDG
jgi:hypothetical protein